VSLAPLVDRALEIYGNALPVENADWRPALFEFFAERLEHVLQRRGFKYDEIRAVLQEFRISLRPFETAKRADALAHARRAGEFEALAILFKRVKNITRDFTPSREFGFDGLRQVLKEPAELALLAELEQRWPRIAAALQHDQFLDAMNQLAPLHAPVDRFFVDVLVMSPDPDLREARLALLATLRDKVLQTSGDISEIAPEER
jgi:glycyl-tRNA synthetase beta chain